MIEPTWMEIARKENGISEFPGTASNPRILEYYRATTLGGNPEDSATPWCSAFVNWVMQEAGYKGTRRANARSWIDWGEKIDEPRHGAIAVLWREDRNGPKGHVAFYVGHAASDRKLILLGGNQANRVGYDTYGPGRVLRYVWPKLTDKLKPSAMA